MQLSLKDIRSAARDSLWLVPALLTLTAGILAWALMAVERHGLLWSGQPPEWVYQGSAQGARSVLSSVVSGLITVTGVIFSLTIVAVQLASSQYTPRVLRNFSSDRGNQLTLGVFIGTFVFGMLVLRTVRSGDEGGDQFIPRLAITVAVALLLVCVGALIYFINHLARELQVTAIVDRVTRETLETICQLFPEQIGEASDRPMRDPREPEHHSMPVRATQAGYIQMVDPDRLFAVGERREVVIAMEPRIGEFVLPGRPVASVRTQGVLTGELEEEIRAAFVLGPERTPEQDVEFGMIQISDIAIKALSPSVNDPTTAVRCIDRLAEVLAELGNREPPEPRRARDGRIRFVAKYTTFEQAVKVAYDDIRHFGAAIPLVAEHLVRTVGELAVRVPENRREPLIDLAHAVLYTAGREITNPADREALEEAVRDVCEQTGADLRLPHPAQGPEQS